MDRKRLKEACQDFESCLTRIILKSMGDSIMRAEEPDQARETYETMFRETLAGELSRHTTGGVADLLYHKLSPLIPDTPRTDTPPPEGPVPVK
ncbi:MAG: hypothetical protein MUC41_06095 [Syntrophobacteraceae bacterium]|nr:hypothetical protein [Syntrophobacteraceae bacterium]